MTNLEKALEKLLVKSDCAYQFYSKDRVVNYQLAKELLELAATPNWKYPEKNEFPEIDKIVFAYYENGTPDLVIYDKIFYPISGCKNELKIIKWCERPIYNDKMTNLEKAKELLEEIYGEPYYAQIILVDRVTEILDIAAQPDWYYTDKNEFPTSPIEVLATFEGIGNRLVAYKNGDWYMNSYIKINKVPVKWLNIPL